jgi:hypothetical protein
LSNGLFRRGQQEEYEKAHRTYPDILMSTHHHSLHDDIGKCLQLDNPFPVTTKTRHARFSPYSVGGISSLFGA